MYHQVLSTCHPPPDNAHMKTAGDIIKEARIRAGYRRQSDLARELERDPSYVSDIERNARGTVLQPDEVHRLRDLLGIQVLDLLAAFGYELEGMDSEEDAAIAELTEHVRIVDWHADPSRLPVMHAILSTWAEFDRNSLRMVAESESDYDNGGR